MDNSTTLNETVWQRVLEILRSKHLEIGDLRQLMGQKGIERHFNTFTAWRRGKRIGPKPEGSAAAERGQRPTLKVTDLEDLAKALDVSPAELLESPGAAPRQLELPFEVDSHLARFELECTGKGVVIRPSRKAAAVEDPSHAKPAQSA